MIRDKRNTPHTRREMCAGYFFNHRQTGNI
nr:MAG TPA: hypothetical protein [Caudoviricetes sp.]